MSENDTKRLSRLTAILIQLQSQRLLTATTLAKKFKVSVRTIYRDIRALEQSGVPILTEEGKGYTLMDGYKIPPIMFTEGEANALITAEQLVLQNNDSSLVKEYCEAIHKIKSVLKHNTKDKANLLANRILISQNNKNTNPSSYLSSLQLALTNFSLCTILYQKLEDTEAHIRTVEPFALLSTQGNWLLLAMCRLRKEFRLFRLDRIKQLRILDEKFEAHNMTLQEYFEISSRQNNP